ncbi:MAG: acetyl-CoA carboxylase carboxyl transferase subunit alpha, partial [Christensenellaceae bacterium]
MAIDIQNKINNLKEDIKKLKSISESNNIDLSDKINDLEEKLLKIKNEIKIELSPYEKV